MKKNHLAKWKIIKICALIIIALALYMPIVKAETSNQTEDYINKTMANPESITEFVKADGSTYNVNKPTKVTKDGLQNVKTLYGRYQFNYTGSGMLSNSRNNSKGKVVALSELGNNEQYYSKLSTVKGYEWLADYENSDAYYNKFKGLNTGKIINIHGNSSAGKLIQENENDKIYKAYLVITTVAKSDTNGNKRYLLNEMPITLIGPNAKYVKTKMEKVYVTDFMQQRYMGYIDVTEFVQEQGYGWYYCCNIPYCRNDSSGWDQYANWRLIVIEENANLGIRALTLRIGKAISSEQNTISVAMNLTDMTTKKEGKVDGQLLYCIDGADMKAAPTTNNVDKMYLNVDKKDKYIVYPEPNPPILDENGYRIVYRTSILKLVDQMTRNNVPIKTLQKFGAAFENVKRHAAWTFRYNGNRYVLGHSRMDGDSELIDFSKRDEEIIGNGKKNIVFNFKAGTDVLFTSVIRFGI